MEGKLESESGGEPQPQTGEKLRLILILDLGG